MKVYVVECGCYDQQGIEGIYATPEAAMEANPVTRKPKPPTRASVERAGGWKRTEYGDWSNGLDWDDAASITEYEVKGMDE